MAVEISTWRELRLIDNDLDGDYVLVNDLDEESRNYASDGRDFTPIGFIEDDSFTSEFTGSFDGGGHSIRDLVIELDDEGDIGLFASIGGDAVVEDVTVAGEVDAGDGRHVGAVVGLADDDSIIRRCVSHADVRGRRSVGGVVGRGNGPLVENCHSTGVIVASEERVGGVGGQMTDTIERCSAHGEVYVGEGSDGGGIAGVASNSGVFDSYSTADVISSTEGLDGRSVGGVAGDGTVVRSFAAGLVVGDGEAGGVIGSFGEVTDSYFDVEATGDPGSNGATELTTSEMQGSAGAENMPDLDFDEVFETVSETDSDARMDGYPVVNFVREVQLQEQDVFLAVSGVVRASGSAVGGARVVVRNLDTGSVMGSDTTTGAGVFQVGGERSSGDMIEVSIDSKDGGGGSSRVFCATIDQL